MRLSFALPMALFTLLAGCPAAETTDCQPGWALCGGVCEELQTDARNCGACGVACGYGQACVAGACAPDCAASLRAPVEDSRGAIWDGLERSKTTWANAEAACAAIGGRLPLVTEAYRVSLKGSGEVGQSYEVNPLWTRVPKDASNTYRVTMSTGLIDGDVTASGSNAYRCVCPPAPPPGFSGYACNGPAGAACTALSGSNAGYSMDSEDRAPISVTGAMAECAFLQARLPTFLTYAEAIVDGLPHGSSTYLHAADATSASANVTVSWTDSATTWTPATSTKSQDGTTALPFRCIGRTTPAPAATGVAVDAFSGAGGVAADAADRVEALWSIAFDACYDVGGHLPYSFELGALVRQGLPGGSNLPLWNADQLGYNGTSAYFVGSTRWNGVALDYEQGSATFVGALDKATTTPQLHRCIYYPVDPAYVPPATTSCSSGCLEVSLGGARGAKLWIDKGNRSPADLISAIDVCRRAGAHLASVRDYMAAVRKGALGGAGAWLHTADIGQYSGTVPKAMQVKWSNVDTGFSDLSAAGYSRWSDVGLGDSAAYRCVWSNEFR
jgi:hypothetical protein